MQRREFVLTLLASPAAAQQASQPAPAPGGTAATGHPGQSIRIQVNEVMVPVTVTDDKGRFVSDLEEKDFRIFDEGKPQRISYFNRDRGQPVVIGFLLDMSNSTRIHWKHFQEAATEMAHNLLPGDKRFAGYLIAYSQQAELLVNTTTDSDLIAEKIRKLKPGGGAAFYDAIYKACTTRELVKGEPYEPRRVLIVIGDGHDTASEKKLDEVVEIAQRNLVTVYGMSTVSYGFASEGEKNLMRICEETGGRVMYPLNNLYKDVSGYLSTPSDEGNYAYKVGTGAYAAEVASGIFRAVAAIAGEVGIQYIMRYTPNLAEQTNPKTFRNIRVEVAGLPNVRIRARKGYYPANP